MDDYLFEGPQQTIAFAMASRAGATYVRLDVSWAAIAPASLPVSGFDPTDPQSPYYRWSAMDAAVAGAEAAGLTPILDIVQPPSWAYAVEPTATGGGTPKIGALGAFATALATHYDGSGTAPTAHVFDVWNEPNFNKNLSPQNPATYGAMVNAVADSVHAVNPANLVVAGELAPFKHKPSGADKNLVTPPLAFMRTLLCLSKGEHPHRTCKATVDFDVWSHHPYSDGSPFAHAQTADGVEIGDLPRMRALLQAAEKLHAIVSAKPVQFWVTESGWSSDPPKAKAVPMALEARWMAESLHQMWLSGVTLATWYLLQDSPRPSPFESGLYFYSTSLDKAKVKPLRTPFRFPFVAYLKAGGKVQVWGRDATSDKQVVTIEQRAGLHGKWRTVARIRSNGSGIFQATMPIGAKLTYWLQASAPGSGKSLAFSLKVPKNENAVINPF